MISIFGRWIAVLRGWAEFPERGRHRSDIKEGYYSYVQDAHVIFYLIRDGGIDIIGIPHRRMDVASYFPG